MKVFFIGLISGVMGTLFFNKIFFDSERQVNRLAEQVIALPVDYTGHRDTFDVGVKDVAEIVAHNKSLSGKLTKMESMNNSSSSIKIASPAQPCDYSLISELNNIGRLNGQSVGHLLSVTEESFASEIADRNWASDYERTLKSMFQDNDAIADYVPEQIECREKSCKISIPGADSQNQSIMSENLLKTIVNNSQGVNGKASIFYDESKSKLIVYLARNEN